MDFEVETAFDGRPVKLFEDGGNVVGGGGSGDDVGTFMGEERGCNSPGEKWRGCGEDGSGWGHWGQLPASSGSNNAPMFTQPEIPRFDQNNSLCASDFLIVIYAETQCHSEEAQT